ncbi:hypothetical protein FV222_00225 [Methylobacterium sp. WL103]|uniref:hypothetical protein n=1 Tax=Methylobacterium sp. WL103 TaxID=2603891 RepID=UPI0011CC887A|nr:hypothetical protein [Methylobacterium sp. WL103]TXN08932.1 hypothetical protein FV222_00225 [Methylobacterium sp. WL103]
MRVSAHPIVVTFGAPTWSTTLNGFDVGKFTDRAVAYLTPRLSAPHTLKVSIDTQQPGAEAQIRKAIEDAVLKVRADPSS